MTAKPCGDEQVDSGRGGCPGAYAFFARYLLMPWQSCLDVGGGLGQGKAILSRRSRRVDAIDRDTRLEAMGVRLGDVADEGTGSYDWVTCVDVIEHVEDDRNFAGHLWRVARRGVLLATCNLDHHPDRHWPYHVREYSPGAFRRLIAETAPSARILQLGGDTYGGHIRFAHLNKDWEHQILIAFKRGGGSVACALRLREIVLRVLG